MMFFQKYLKLFTSFVFLLIVLAALQAFAQDMDSQSSSDSKDSFTWREVFEKRCSDNDGYSFPITLNYPEDTSFVVLPAEYLRSIKGYVLCKHDEAEIVNYDGDYYNLGFSIEDEEIMFTFTEDLLDKYVAIGEEVELEQYAMGITAETEVEYTINKMVFRVVEMSENRLDIQGTLTIDAGFAQGDSLYFSIKKHSFEIGTSGNYSSNLEFPFLKLSLMFVF